ncbi:MAG: hypothetical protein U1E27_02925 [Kiritimatiellia bacterium]|nr:hypothetical protein [Kiritimatiellia bacterium]
MRIHHSGMLIPVDSNTIEVSRARRSAPQAHRLHETRESTGQGQGTCGVPASVRFE